MPHALGLNPVTASLQDVQRSCKVPVPPIPTAFGPLTTATGCLARTGHAESCMPSMRTSKPLDFPLQGNRAGRALSASPAPAQREVLALSQFELLKNIAASVGHTNKHSHLLLSPCHCSIDVLQSRADVRLSWSARIRVEGHTLQQSNTHLGSVTTQ